MEDIHVYVYFYDENHNYLGVDSSDSDEEEEEDDPNADDNNGQHDINLENTEAGNSEMNALSVPSLPVSVIADQSRPDEHSDGSKSDIPQVTTSARKSNVN
jgi:hypothetical protein